MSNILYKNDDIILFDSIEQTICYFADRVSNYIKLSNSKGTKNFSDKEKQLNPEIWKFEEEDKNFLGIIEYDLPNILKTLMKELRIQENHFLYAIELFLKILESSNLSYELINNHIWLLFKTCLYLSQICVDDVAWTLENFAVLTKTKIEDLKLMEQYILNNVAKFRIIVSRETLTKTKEYLRGVSKLCK